jgi:hypothetical protein
MLFWGASGIDGLLAEQGRRLGGPWLQACDPSDPCDPCDQRDQRYQSG